MAVVLSSSQEDSYFSHTSALRRSHSGKFSPSHQTYSTAQIPHKSRSSTSFNTVISPPSSPVSSTPSSPSTLHASSTTPSYSTTPASSLSLDSRCEDEDDDDDQIVFPSYDEVGYYDQVEDLEPPASPGGNGDSYTVSPTNSTASSVSRPASPEPVEHAEDDTAIREHPTRHVDYLSHSWKEEDIWSSWKHIVSKRGHYSNSARLENASWRQWIKSKYKLKTISPEHLNWLKDCDVTWLYGPLQTGADKSLHMQNHSPVGSRMSKSHSFLHKKPILKKRSMSEMMLQRSLSASSLVKQAAAAVQAQQSDRRPVGALRAQSDYTFQFSSRRLSRENTSVLPSISSSGVSSRYGERKHIHFNEEVEQCIALDVKGDDDDEVDSYAIHDDYDSDSDDGAIMMKRSKTKKKLPVMRKKTSPRDSFGADSKTIAMLPNTTLKYREDTPEPQETAMKHSNFWSTKLSPSASQETLRPSKPSTRILLADDDEDDDVDIDWQPNAFLNRKDSVSVTTDRMQALQRTGSSGSLTGEPSGMRRTPSGMFMPYEEDEDDIVSEGLFGRVVDTVNTAKDIAHVIWNVGWRR